MNEELAALQEVIQDIHQLMTIVKDPAHTNVIAQCLRALTGIQKEMMQPQGGQQAVLSQLGGQQQ